MAVRAALLVFLALLVWAPWPLGSNRPWAWTILELGIFLAAALWLVGFIRGEIRDFSVLQRAWPALAVFAAWLAYLSVYWIALPAAWVQWLSPESAAVQRAAAAYTADGGASMTLSVDPHASFAFWLISCAYALAFALTLAFASSPGRWC